jgi:hypothetical protein
MSMELSHIIKIKFVGSEVFAEAKQSGICCTNA